VEKATRRGVLYSPKEKRVKGRSLLPNQTFEDKKNVPENGRGSRRLSLGDFIKSLGGKEGDGKESVNAPVWMSSHNAKEGGKK